MAFSDLEICRRIGEMHCLHLQLTVKMEAVSFTETPANMCQTAERRISENTFLHSYCFKNLKKKFTECSPSCQCHNMNM